MRSRARIAMAVPIFISVSAVLGLATHAGSAQDLAAGKTPQQLFNSDCSACHPRPAGLAKGRDARTLGRFLNEHYTTQSAYASAIATYVVAFDAPPGLRRSVGDAPPGLRRSVGDALPGPRRSVGDAPLGPRRSVGDAPLGPRRSVSDAPQGPRRSGAEARVLTTWP
jgi:hypothetical protein